MHQYIRPAAPPPTICPHLLRDCCRAWLAIDAAGYLDTLVEELNLARQDHRQQHADRRWANRLTIDRQARDLGKLLDHDADPIRDALRDQLAPSWPTVAATTIIAFARRIRSTRQGYRLLPAGGGR